MIKNILGLLIGLSILGYGGYHSIKLASLSKPKFVSNNSSNIDLSEEKWVKPIVQVQPEVVSPPPVSKSPAKGKAPKKAKKPPTTTCTMGTGRIKVSGANMTCVTKKT